jgi:hypothetical protein
VFVDFEKGFDSIHRNKVWEVMNRYGIPCHITDLINISQPYRPPWPVTGIALLLLFTMVYLTMLSRANITESVYGILPLGRYLNVVRGFVCVQVTWRAMLLGA